MSTVLTNGIIIPENGSRNWGGDLANNWNIIDVNVGYMTDVKNKVTTLENSVAENTANIQTNASNISALQTSKQDVIEDLETIRTGASSGATAVQPSALSDYYTKAEVDTNLSSKANASDLRNYLALTGGAITGNIKNSSDSDGWKPGFEWLYNNERFAYIHAFTDEARGEKSLTIQADTHISLISQNLFLNGKAPAYAYNTTSAIGNIHVGSVLTGNAKNVAFIVPLNVDGSPAITFDKLVIRCDGNYLFGSTSNSNVTTSYTFTSTIVKGGLIFVLTFSDAETKVPNNSCVVTHVALRLTY